MAKRSVKRQQWTSLIFALAALLVFGASPGRAGTETGASGLILVPSADTLAPGDAEFAVRYKDGRLGGSFTYGIFDRIEIGVNNMRKSSTSDFGIVIKGAIFEETASEPAVAVGFETGQSYVVVSKRLAPRVRAHLGLGAGDLEGVFAGVALVVNTTTGRGLAPATTAMAEVTPRGVNAGVRLVFSPLVSADVALVDLEELVGGISFRVRF